MNRKKKLIKRLKKSSKHEVMWFIRGVLTESGKKLRFDMSENAPINELILDRFSFLNFNDYAHKVDLDCYKGTVDLTVSYLNQRHKYELSGYTTSEIIYTILHATVLSGRKKIKTK